MADGSVCNEVSFTLAGAIEATHCGFTLSTNRSPQMAGGAESSPRSKRSAMQSMAGNHHKARANMTLQHAPFLSEIDDNDKGSAVTPIMFRWTSRRSE